MGTVLDVLILLLVVTAFVYGVKTFFPNWWTDFKASISRIWRRIKGEKPDSGGGGTGGGAGGGTGGGDDREVLR